jgi:DNA-binding NtrC family response regulator
MNGFSARFFTSPVKALAAARSESPDLVVSDVAMPGVSGIDLAIQMRAQCPNCQILLFSGQATTLDLLEGAQGYDFRLLQKPVHPSQFLSEIGELSTPLKLTGKPAKAHEFSNADLELYKTQNGLWLL